MLLKCETTLNVYQHKDKTILCRVLPTDGTNLEKQTTCRSMTVDQWNTFDKELRCWLENNDCELKEQSCKFNVTQNLEVNVRKSTLPAKYFHKCIRNGDNCEDLNAENGLHVLDCSLQYKSAICKYPPTPSIPQDEYEPIPTAGMKNKTTSPLTYEPYTPSKRRRQHSALDKIKTPGTDFLGFNSIEDTYSPKPIASILATDDDALSTNGTESTIPKYKPAPIIEKRLSQDSHQSNLTESIPETDDELLPDDVYRSRRTRLKSKHRKPSDHGEYIPESQDLTVKGVPAYNPTPIDAKKPEKLKVPKETEKSREIAQELHQDKERKKTDTCDEDKKIKVKKDKSPKETNEPVSRMESKQTSNTIPSSGDEFENGSSKRKDKDNRKKERIDESERGGSKHKEKDSKSKEKRKSKENRDDRETKRNETPNDILAKKQTSKERLKLSPSVRRSERSPSKPRRFIEEQEKFEVKKKTKSIKTSPTNKELFGTDDDDDGNKKQSDSNNNANNKPSVYHTPKPDKKIASHMLSSSSSSSSKKKRKRNDCEQEKADINNWLKKRDKNHDATPESSKGKSSSVKNEKKIKSSKDDKSSRPKSVTPLPMDIVMPSKEELEILRNKHKLQREENEKFKAALEKIIVPPPKEVEQLSLRDMTLDDLLDTFTIYKSDLDEIYEKNRKKDYVKGNDGINHCLVIGLTDQRIQLKMLEKLSDVYNTSNSTTQATLYANALLPEWIIRVFMKKYKLNRLQAISQIENQDAYKSYIEGQNENSLLFDD